MPALKVVCQYNIFAEPTTIKSFSLAYVPHKWPSSEGGRPRTIKRVLVKTVPELLDLGLHDFVVLQKETVIDIEDIEEVIPDLDGFTLRGKPYLWLKLKLGNLFPDGVNIYYQQSVAPTGYFPLVRTLPEDVEKLRKKFKNLPRVDHWPEFN